MNATAPRPSNTIARPCIIDNVLHCRCQGDTPLHPGAIKSHLVFYCVCCGAAFDRNRIQFCDAGKAAAPVNPELETPHSPAAAITPAQAVAASGLPATDGAREGEGSPTPVAERPAPVRDIPPAREMPLTVETLLADAVRRAADATFSLRSQCGPTPTVDMLRAAQNLRTIAEDILFEIKHYAFSRPDARADWNGDFESLLK